MISFSFFIVSFIPLWVIFLVNLFLISDTEIMGFAHYVAYALIAIIIFCSVIVSYYMKVNKTENSGDYYNIEKIENVTSEQALYAVAYITPFITTDFTNLQSTIGVFILLIVIATIFTREKMFYVNPILMWFGYHFYKVNISHKKFVFICKHNIENQDRIRAKKVTNEILIEVNDK